MDVRNAGRIGYGVLILALALGLVALMPEDVAARHDLNNSCYVCHNIRTGETWTGSNAIWTGISIGVPTPVSQPLNCDVCHTDYGLEFKDFSVVSNHPAWIVNGLNDLAVPNAAKYPKTIRCLDCHKGDTYAGSPNFLPDLGPAAYDNAARSSNSDGYANHDLAAYDQVLPGTDNLLRFPNANLGPVAHLAGAYYNYSVDNAAYAGGSAFALCFACHGATAADNTVAGKNVKADYDAGGHYFRGGADAGKRMACYICHDVHTATSVGLYKPPSGGSAVSDNNGRATCLDCHARGGGNPTVGGVVPPAPTTNVTAHPGHATPTAERCDICHRDHYPGISVAGGAYECLSCHTATSATTKPSNGAYDYSYIDNLFKGVGPDNDALSGTWSQHDIQGSADCAKCHGDLHRVAADPPLVDPDPSDAIAFVYDGGLTDINDFCLSCHDGGNQASTQFGGQNPPNVLGNNSTWGWNVNGHGKMSGTYSPSVNPAANLKCLDCHAVHGSDAPHLLIHEQTREPHVRKTFSDVKIVTGTIATLGASSLDYTDYTNSGNAGGAFADNWPSDKGFGTTGDPASQYGPGGATVGLCDACHRSATHTDNTTGKAHTHMGIAGAGDPPSQMSFVRDCVECHNPHGSPNIYMVADNLFTRNNPAGRPVTFTATTGTNSFDDAADAGGSNAGDLCTVCHEGWWENPGLNVSHNHFSPDNSAHNEGTNCAACHAHGKTDNAAAFGFPQLGCNACHGSSAGASGMPAPGDGGTYHVDANNVIGTRGSDNAVHKIHVEYIASKYASLDPCTVCHNGGGSAEQGGHPGNKTNASFKSGATPDNVLAVQVSLDNAFKLPGYQSNPTLDNAYRGKAGSAADDTNGWKTCLTTCHAGSSPSWAGKTQVSANTVTFVGADNTAPDNVLKGSTRVKMLRFSLSSDLLVGTDNQATWAGLTVLRTGTGADNTVADNGVVVYADTGSTDNVLDGTDPVVGRGTFVNGAAQIALSAQTITAAAKDYFVGLDIASGAVDNATVGVRLENAGAFRLSSADNMKSDGFPAYSAPLTSVQTPPAGQDTLSVAATPEAPLWANPGNTIAMEKLAMTVSGTQDNSATWTSVRVTWTGQGSTADVDNVIVCLDNGNGSWDGPATDTPLGSSTAWVGDNTTVSVGSQAVTNVSPKTYFVVYHIASGATIGDNAALRIANASAFTLSGAGDVVDLSPSPANSGTTEVQAAVPSPDQLTVTDDDALSPANVAPGTSNVAVLALGMSVAQGSNNDGSVTISQVRVDRSGTGSVDADVGAIKIYRESGVTAGFQAAQDTLVSSGTDVFSGGTKTMVLSPSQAVTTAGATFYVVYDVAAGATSGHQLGANLTDNSYLTITSSPDVALGTNAPWQNGARFVKVNLPQTTLYVSGLVSQTSWTCGDWATYLDNQDANIASTTTNGGVATVDIDNVTFAGTVDNVTVYVRARYTTNAERLSVLVSGQTLQTVNPTLNTWADYPFGPYANWDAATVNAMTVQMTAAAQGGWGGGSQLEIDQVRVVLNAGIGYAPPRETGGGTGIACNSCHQFAPVDNGIASTGGFYDAVNYQYYITETGSHPKHGVGNIAGADPVSGDAANTCTVCHLAGTGGFGYGHSDNVLDLRSGSIGTRTDTVVDPDTGTYNAGTRQCSSTYCHGGQATPMGATKSWGYGTAACNSCHAYGLSPAVPATGAHGRHDNTAHNNGAESTSPTRASNAGGYSFSCSYCHYGTSHVSYPVSANQAAQVTFGGALGDNGDIGAGSLYAPAGSSSGSEGGKLSWTSGTCSVYCHSNASPVGSANVPDSPAWAGSVSCGISCHGNDGLSGRDLIGNPLSTRLGSPAHRRHVSSTAYSFTCSQCHAGTVTGAVNTTVNVFDNHVDGQKDVRFSTVRATSIDQSGGGWSGAGRTCSATYCHSAGTDNNAAGGFDNAVSVSWTDALSCASCHRSDNGSGSPMATGSHKKHLDGNIRCSACHSRTAQSDNNYQIASGGYAYHVNGYRNVAILSTYDTNGGTPEDNWDSANKTCSATYCHGTGASPAWDPPGATTCQSCHQSQGAYSASFTGRHRVHTDNGTSNYRFACEVCHAANASSHAETTHAGGDDNTASARTVEVLFTDNSSPQTYGGSVFSSRDLWTNPYGGAGSPSYGEGSYTAGDNDSVNPAISWTRGGCSNVWCHSNANPQPAGGGIYTPAAPTWDNGTSGSCTACHKGAAAYATMSGASPQMSRGHWEHLSTDRYNFTCDECHANTVAADSRTAIAAATGYGTHLNGSRNDNGVDIKGGVGIRGTTIGDNALSYNPGTRVCSNTYCHSDGKDNTAPFAGSVPSPAWDNAAGTSCTSCHGGGGGASTTLGGSHGKHVNSMASGGSGIGCERCHAGTASNSTTLSGYDNHVNGFPTVVISGGGSYAGGGGSCAATYCHGTSSPAWVGGTTTCQSCHVSNGILPGQTPTGAHARHTDNTTYQVACEQCHATQNASDNTSHAGGPASGTNPGGAAVNASTQTTEIRFASGVGTTTYNGVPGWDYANLSTNPYTGGAATAGYASLAGGTPTGTDNLNSGIKWGAGSCSAVWCHSNAKPLLPTGVGRGADNNVYAAPAWAAPGSPSCTACHEGGDTAAAMAYNASTNRNAMSDRHVRHVASDRYNYTCDECHAYTVADDSDNTILSGVGYDNHVDGTKRVRLSATSLPASLNQGGAIYNGSFQCQNTYCHSNGQSTDPPFGSATSLAWNSATGTTCSSCHGNGAATLLTNAHPRHLQSGISCQACHVRTADNGVSLNPSTGYAYHVNGAKDVAIAGAYDNDATPGNNYLGGSCSAVSCHGGVPVSWTAGSLSCDACHTKTGNVNATDVDDYVYNAGTGTMSKVSPTDYANRGHGLPGGTLPWTGGGSPWSTFGRAMVCLDCHGNAAGALHDNASNPFRFKATINAQAVAFDNVTTVCYACHASASVKEHAKAVTGGGSSGWEHGQKCVDCHDVHGEGNIFMVQDSIVWQTSGSPDYLTSSGYGIPYNPSSRTAVSFAANAAGSDYADAGTGASNRICEVCHTRTAQYQKDNANGKGGNMGHSTSVCTGCHKHNAGFKGSGGNNIEQFLDGVTGSPTTNYEDRSRHPVKLAAPLTYGTELNCLTCHGVTSGTNVSNECLTCHWENRSSGTPGHPNGTFEWATPSAPAANHDNGAATDTWCLLCHGNVGSPPPLNGATPKDVLPGTQTWTGGSGHGSTVSLSGGSAGPPAYSCRACHYSTAVRTSSADPRDQTAPGFHGSVNRKLVANDNVSTQEYPHTASTVHATQDARSTQMNAFCAGECHRNPAAPAKDDNVVDHSWAPIQSQTKAGSESHPSNMAPAPSGRFKNPAALPLSDWLTGSYPGSGNEVCTSCHDAHGGNNAQTDKQMLRMEWNNTTSDLCKECHV